MCIIVSSVLAHRSMLHISNNNYPITQLGELGVCHTLSFSSPAPAFYSPNSRCSPKAIFWSRLNHILLQSQSDASTVPNLLRWAAAAL